MVRTARDKERKAKYAHERWRTVHVEIEGVHANMFTIGALAHAVGKGISTLRVWEAKGLLPETPYRTGAGARLYSVEMMQQLKESLELAGKIATYKPAVGGVKLHVVKTVQFAGKEPQRVKLYRVGLLATAIHRSANTIAMLEDRGGIPQTPFVTGKQGIRLYTIEMIEAIQKAFAIRRGSIRGPLEWQCVYNEVVREWTKLGIPGAKVIGSSEKETDDE